MGVTLEELERSPLYSEELGISLKTAAEEELLQMVPCERSLRRKDFRSNCEKDVQGLRKTEPCRARGNPAGRLGFPGQSHHEGRRLCAVRRKNVEGDTEEL